MPVKKGDRFVAACDIPAIGLSLWAAPYTGSFNCVIPRGTVFVADHDQREGYEGFGCTPEEYKALEKKLVPRLTRWSLRYRGYYFVFYSKDIDTSLIKC